MRYSYSTGRDKQIHDFSTRAGEYDVYIWNCVYTGAFTPHCYQVEDLKAKYPEIGLDPNRVPTELVVPKVLEDVYTIGRFFTKKFNPESLVEAGNTIIAMIMHTVYWEYC